MKLDLGAGATSPEGFTPRGRQFNTEIFPLPYHDSSIEEIRSSHVLEHFPTAQVPVVLKEWVRALAPGGRLRIAVPDFVAVGEMAKAGHPMALPVMFGGQVDDDDFHKSGFTERTLRTYMADLGLVLLRPWKSELEDCAAYPFSLNIEGTKPFVDELKVSACMSVPRLGFMDNARCAMEGLIPIGIKLRYQGGAFWGQSLTKCLEAILEEDDPDAILTLDYDTVFTVGNTARIIETMMAHPKADAISAVQSSRHLETALFTVRDEHDVPIPRLNTEELASDLLKASSAHFGFTLIRAKKLREMPKPWFHSVPAPDGTWGDGHIDEDVQFWETWRQSGNSLFIANRIVVGHMELCVRWPGNDLQVILQPVREFNETHSAPEGAWR